MTTDNTQGENTVRRSLREQTRQWIIAAGTGLAVLATVFGFLSDTLGLWEQVQPILGGATPTPALVVEPQTGITQSLVIAPVETPTPVASPTPTAIPIVAAENETLLVVAQFANYAPHSSFNVAGRIGEALSEQVGAAKLQDTRVALWPEAVESVDGADRLLDATRAALLIWGEYDSGRVRVNFALPGAAMGWEQHLSTPDELSTIINLDVPRESQALALMALGRLYRGRGELTKAQAAFKQTLAQEPTSSDTVATLNFYLGYLATQQAPADYDAAIGYYSKVIALRADWVNAHYNRGGAYLDRFWQTGDSADLDLAIEDFSWTLDAQASYAEAYVNRGVAYYTRNGDDDLTLALADFDSAIRYSPDLVRAYYNRGLAHIRANHPEQWEADLLHTLALQPEYWAAHYALCWGYALDSRPQEALPHCDVVAEVDSSGASSDAHGLVMAQLGRYDEAADQIEQYVAWLQTQPGGATNLAQGPDYAAMIEMLRAGQNPVTPELLEQLR